MKTACGNAELSVSVDWTQFDTMIEENLAQVKNDA
jgi:hypothetical protein